MSTETDTSTTKPPLDLDAIEARAHRVYPERGWDGDEASRARATVVEDIPSLVAAVRARDAEVARLTRERDAQREIIDGRTVPPTAAQIEALALAGGRVTIAFSAALHHYNPRDGSDMRSLCRLAAYPAAEGDVWHATDKHGRPCAWPEVTP